MSTTLLTSAWSDVLATHRLRVLPHSRFVPIDVWLEHRHSPGQVLHLLARGTRVRLTAYDRSDLTALLLRAECDCEEHRQAGAAGRLVLSPGAVPVAAAEYDGSRRAGWRGVQAGLLRRGEVAPILDGLWAMLAGDAPATARTA